MRIAFQLFGICRQMMGIVISKTLYWNDRTGRRDFDDGNTGN